MLGSLNAKEKLILSLSIAIICILIGAFTYFAFNESGTNSILKTYTPQDNKGYEKIWTGNKSSPYDHHQKSPDPEEIEQGGEAIPLPLGDTGFEEQGYWSFYGQADFSESGCYSGSSCMHVKADGSGYGVFSLNSGHLIVEPGKSYYGEFMVNCLDCSGNSSYLALIWIKDEPWYYGNAYAPIQEIRRVIKVLDESLDGKGYQKVRIYDTAPEGTDYAILGIRVHTEGARLTPLAEFYIDGVD